MFFTVLEHGMRVPNSGTDQAFLLTDNWDDWFKYNTSYVLFYFDANGGRHNLGGLKIGQFNMTEGQRRPIVPSAFDALDDRFFSIGQDDSYYDDLNSLGAEVRDKVLRGLRDMAADLQLFERALDEKVTGVSLLRSVTTSTVRGQYSRMAKGGVRLSRYQFSYTAPKPPRMKADPVTLNFVVEPASLPPTNIHVLIGRNGVGKTHLLNNMTRAIVQGEEAESNVGTFSGEGADLLDDRAFASLVSVTFSAFDPFEPLPVRQNKAEGVQYAYIGLKRGPNDEGKPRAPKTPDSLASEFSKAAWICKQGARLGRWRRALEMLEADPIFSGAGVAELASDAVDEDELRAEARKIFDKLSSGHKIVLLTITRLVETVEERTLVLLDEPEAHLHPPLLSAFVRALSDLLINRNGVAIIATHSPVVLQEVPRRCAWKVRRNGRLLEVERPDIETFGENVGILTREVFGLEVTHAGFHTMLGSIVREGKAYDEIIEAFGGRLGGEARAIVRGLIAERDQRAPQ